MGGGSGKDWGRCMTSVQRQRCETSFRQIFQYFLPRIHSFFLNSGFDSHRSSELAQEVLYLVWQKSDLFDAGKGSLSTWIFTIARNLKFDLLRKNRRDVLAVGSEDIFERHDASDFDLDEQMLKGDLRKHINELPVEQKDAVEAVYMQGYSTSQYAEDRSLPLGTVKSRIRLALGQLRRDLDK